MPDLRVKILVFQQDGTVISQYLLGEGEHPIGRDPNSAIYCESAHISNDHAKLHLSDEGIFIEDLNSTSGTFLDQINVRGKVRLTPGQRLQVGDLHIDLQLEGVGDLSPGVKIGAGRYQLNKELGRGAMGQVWLAQDTQLDEYVAIKVLPSDVANDAVCLLDLKREVQKSRKLSHDNIIRIHDLIQLPGENPFVSLEFVQGTDLHAIQMNQSDRIFGWAEVKPYVLQLCDALDYAHERKIVHRDLKPANIMITNDGVLKLADFGIAASIADSTGRSSMADVISGTPQFMSPQQMLGEAPRASDDIYALGATMYCLLTGRPPFHTGDIAQQAQHITPAPLEQRLTEFGLENEVPGYVNDVVMSCLAKDATARPASVGAIGEWLRTEGQSDRPAERKKTETGIERMVAEKPVEAVEAELAVEEQPTQAQPETTQGKKSPVLAIAAAFIVVAALGWFFMGGSGDSEKTTPETPGPPAKKPGQTTPGRVIAWGDNEEYQLDVPEDLKDVIQISSTSRTTLALKANGTVAVWGKNMKEWGQQIAALKDIKSVACGLYHYLALTKDDKVVIGGNRGYQWENLTDVSAISTRSLHNMALRKDGTVIAWRIGANSDIGLKYHVPEGLRDIVAIAAGDYHCLALKKDGTVVAWQDEKLTNHRGEAVTLTDQGQLNVPGDLKDVIAIDAYNNFNLALKRDGTVVAWGRNHEKQCDVPDGLKDVIAIACGGYHSMALKKDGTVVAWGADSAVNSKGQANVPEGLTNVTAIDAGMLFSMAIVDGPIPTNDPLGKAIAQNNGDLKKALVQITKGHSQPAKFDRDGNLIFLNLSDDKTAGLKISDASLAHLKGPEVQSLRALNIGGASELTEKCLPYLVQLKGLQDLYMGSFLSDQGLKYLADELPSSITTLQLEGNYLRQEGLSAEGLNHLRQGAFKKVDTLSLLRFDFSGKGSLDFSSDLFDLTTFNLHYAKVNDSAIGKISHRPALKYLKLFLKGDQTGLTDQALIRLKSMSKLEKLELSDAPFSRNALAYLRKSLPNCEVIIHAPTSLDKGLIAYYPFNGNANDESGGGLHGTLKGKGDYINNAQGKPNSAIYVDAGSYIDVPLNPVLVPDMSSFTVSLWFKTAYAGSPRQPYLICSTSLEYTIGFGGHQLYVRVKDNGKESMCTAEKYKELIKENEWAHVSLVIDRKSNVLRGYLNGEASHFSTPPELPKEAIKMLAGKGNHFVRMGAQGRYDKHYTGAIDDVRIYNRALSAEEITVLYDLEKPSSETASGKKPGTLLWEFETAGEVHSSPAIGSDGTIYVGSKDGKVYALNGQSGAKKWEFTTGGYVYSSPTIGSDGTIYVGSSDNKIYSLDGATGVRKWEFTTGVDIQSSPAIGADDTVYVGSYDGKVYALNGKSGVKKWEFETGGHVHSSPAIGSDGTVYVGSKDQRVYALDGKTGAKKWEFETGDWVLSSPALGSDGTLYAGGGQKKVYALDGATGVKIWEFRPGSDVHSSSAIGTDGTVYVGSYDNKVYALNGKTGARKWEFETGGKVDSSPAIGSDGTVYVGSMDNKVYALNGQTGGKQWEFETGRGVNSSPSIGPDGIIYIGSTDKKIYAIATSSKGLADSPWPMFGQNAQHTGRTITGSHKKFRLNQIKEYELRSLNENPSFEQGKSGWVPGGGEIILVPNNNDLAGGKNALTLKKPAGYGRLGTANKINLKAGKKYRTIIVLTDEIDIPRAAGDCLVQYSGGVVMGNDTYTTYHSGGKTILDQVISFPEDRSLHFQYALFTKEQITFEHFFIVEERNTTSVIPNSPEAAAAIEAAIRKAAGKPTGELTQADLEKVTQLKGLSLKFNRLTDVKGLEKLDQLTFLNLNGNQLTDVKGLEKLTQLETLYLEGNQLTDVKGLENLTKLNGLYLRNNPDLTKAQIDQLQKALPKCKINHEGTK